VWLKVRRGGEVESEGDGEGLLVPEAFDLMVLMQSRMSLENSFSFLSAVLVFLSQEYLKRKEKEAADEAAEVSHLSMPMLEARAVFSRLASTC
jgi:hypothetical protein